MIYVIPTKDQVDQIIASSEAIISSMQGMVSYVDEEKKDYPDLGTLPVKQTDVDKLKNDLEAVKKPPYA